MTEAWEAIDRLPPNRFPRERTETLALIARFFYLDGQTQPAIYSAAKAVEAAVLGKHADLEVIARSRYGVALRLAFDFSGATRELVHGIEIARQRGMADWEAKLLNSLGNTYNEAGMQHEALELFERAAAFFESNGDPLSLALDNAALARCGWKRSVRRSPSQSAQQETGAMSLVTPMKDCGLFRVS